MAHASLSRLQYSNLSSNSLVSPPHASTSEKNIQVGATCIVEPSDTKYLPLANRSEYSFYTRKRAKSRQNLNEKKITIVNPPSSSFAETSFVIDSKTQETDHWPSSKHFPSNPPNEPQEWLDRISQERLDRISQERLDRISRLRLSPLEHSPPKSASPRIRKDIRKSDRQRSLGPEVPGLTSEMQSSDATSVSANYSKFSTRLATYDGVKVSIKEDCVLRNSSSFLSNIERCARLRRMDNSCANEDHYNPYQTDFCDSSISEAPQNSFHADISKGPHALFSKNSLVGGYKQWCGLFRSSQHAKLNAKCYSMPYATQTPKAGPKRAPLSQSADNRHFLPSSHPFLSQSSLPSSTSNLGGIQARFAKYQARQTPRVHHRPIDKRLSMPPPSIHSSLTMSHHSLPHNLPPKERQGGLLPHASSTTAVWFL